MKITLTSSFNQFNPAKVFMSLRVIDKRKPSAITSSGGLGFNACFILASISGVRSKYLE